MEIENLILIIIAVLNFFVGLVIILRNYKSQINWSFGLLLMSVVGWSIGLSLSRELAGSVNAIFWSKSCYYFAALIAYFLLYFSLVFPLGKQEIEFKKKIFLFLPLLFIFLILIKGNLLIIGLVEKPWGYD